MAWGGAGVGRAVVGVVELLLGLEDGPVVVVEGLLELLVGVDQTLHGVVVWRGVFAGHVGLDAARCARTPVGKFLDEVVGEDFGGRGACDDLLEEPG